MLLSRMVGFFKKQLDSQKFCIRFLIKICENDQWTNIGKTLDHVMKQCNVRKADLNGLTTSMIKRKMQYMPVSDDEKWCVLMLKDLLSTRNGRSDIPGFSSKDIKDAIKWLCTYPSGSHVN